jgi:hypothetical protein
MGDLLRARALQASGWRESGRPVVEVRVQIYAHIESDVIIWHVNVGALDLYRAAVGWLGHETRVDSLPSTHAPAVLLDAVDYGLRSVLRLGTTLPGLW